jgi:hypothetical protein
MDWRFYQGVRMPAAKRASQQEVDLLGLTELIHHHLTKSLSRRVYRSVRTVERQRKWAFHQMAQFWIAVTLRAPESLRQALACARTGKEGIYPNVSAAAEAFFEKCHDMTWRFFQALHQDFIASILPEAPKVYAQELGDIWRRFPHILVLDGSKCDAIRRRLKLLWREKSVVLPGNISALYDLGKGICRHLAFSPNAAEHELKRVEVLLEQVPQGALLMGDRLYALMKFILLLQARGLWGLFRRNKLVKFHHKQLLSRTQNGRVIVEDWLVSVGSGPTKMRLRWIRCFRQSSCFELVTTVLDPRQLSAAEALQVYPCRWQVERLFYDLKEVLNLHRFYAANPNAVAMQIYAAAIVHTACRIAQARLAQQQGIAPEQISPAKLYPQLAAASCYTVHLELYHQELETMHGLLARPSLSKFQFATTTLDSIMVEKRKRYRRKKRFHPQRRRWKSLTHITGFKKLS